MSQKYQNVVKYQKELLSSKELRIDLANRLCAHLAEGLSMQCFPSISRNFLATLIKDYPEDFDKDMLDAAMVDGQEWWERLGSDQANGKNVGNSRTWYYNMSNRYGWCDKVDLKAKHEGSLNVSIVNYSKPSSS